jgi:LDH2 family malate/lactate/ureidoglycolate dehydrogenase
MAESDTIYSYVTASNAKAFVEGVLVGNGVAPENASIVADCLVQADMRGVDTQWVKSLTKSLARASFRR